ACRAAMSSASTSAGRVRGSSAVSAVGRTTCTVETEASVAVFFSSALAMPRLTRPPATTRAARPAAAKPAGFSQGWGDRRSTSGTSCAFAGGGTGSDGIGFSGARLGRLNGRGSAVDQAEDDGHEHQGGDGGEDQP